ncbi:MAG: hypothetical protein ACFE8M_09075 [Candidatus Hermodarchaeota archaeon]
MTSKRFLSEKRTTHQSISISPALKDWIERYVSVNQQKFPEDDRFRSVSAFYNYVMEKVMNIFQKGKGLDDFERFVDIGISGFYRDFSFRATIPQHEPSLEKNRYSGLSYEKITSYLFAFRKYLLKNIDIRDISTITNLLERFKNYALANKTARDYRFEVVTGKDSKYPTLIWEIVGIYRNISYESYKFFVGTFGFIGIKLINAIYSEHDNYCRMDFKPTDLYFEEKLMKSKRIELMNENLRYFTNYSRILEDDDYFLWMNLAEEKEFLINFNNEKNFRKKLDSIIDDIKRYSEKEKFDFKVLKLFEKLHWIEIIDNKKLTFRIRLDEKKFQLEREFLIKTLLNNTKITKRDDQSSLQ